MLIRTGLASAESSANVARSSAATRLACIARCVSSSVDMVTLVRCSVQKCLCVRRFLQEDFKRRHVVVPFDQRGDRPKVLESLCVQRPYLTDYAGAVIIDTQFVAIRHGADRMA